MKRRSEDRIELLRQVALFSSCSRKDLERIAALTTPVDVTEGEVLAREGKPGSELFVIGSGTALVTLRGRRLARLYPGEAFGEMALLDRAPRAATVTAETPMRLYVAGPREFSTLLLDVPAVGTNLLKSLARRLRQVETLAAPPPANGPRACDAWMSNVLRRRFTPLA